MLEKWSNGVLEYWSGAVVCLLITDLLITGYFWEPRNTLADEQELVPTNHFSLFTFHLSRSPPRSINERARGQYDNQDGSFGSDLPIG